MLGQGGRSRVKKWGKSYGVSKLVRLEDAEEEAVG